MVRNSLVAPGPLTEEHKLYTKGVGYRKKGVNWERRWRKGIRKHFEQQAGMMIRRMRKEDEVSDVSIVSP